jgi:two-component system sensor histidine kinase VicK
MEPAVYAEKFGAMIEKADEVFFIFNYKEGRFKYVNAAFEVLTKRRCEELYENTNLLLKIIHREDLRYVISSFNSILEKKENTMLDFRILHPDGRERWVKTKVYLGDDDGLYIAGIAEDDTIRKSTIFNMQKVNGWKDANLEIIAHDLRGPIGTVKMLAQIINKNLPDNNEVRKLTQMIEDISKRNINLIQELLTKETFDTAAVQVSKERLDVVWEITQAMDIYRIAKDDIKRKITFSHSQDQIYAMVDSMKFLQVINNLVSNAIKFTKDNGSIKVHVERLEKTFLVTVEDDGVGIPRKLQPFLFHKYTVAGREGLSGENSIGLGMWIVKKITEDHGGTIWFKSEIDKGSTFSVEIPIGF